MSNLYQRLAEAGIDVPEDLEAAVEIIDQHGGLLPEQVEITVDRNFGEFLSLAVECLQAVVQDGMREAVEAGNIAEASDLIEEARTYVVYADNLSRQALINGAAALEIAAQ